MNLKAQLYSGELLEFNIREASCIIGRSSKCSVVIPYNGISRQHVKLEIVNGDVYVTDLASINGVSIQGERIPPSTRVNDTELRSEKRRARP